MYEIGIALNTVKNLSKPRLASVSILEKKREPGLSKLSWHFYFDTRFGRNVFQIYFVQNPVRGIF